MSFNPETIIFLLQFDTGVSYREMARQELEKMLFEYDNTLDTLEETQ